MSPEHKALIKDLSFAELQELAEACSARMEELRHHGVVEMFEQIEAMTTEKLGMSSKQLMAAYRKTKRAKTGRGRRSANGEATTTD